MRRRKKPQANKSTILEITTARSVPKNQIPYDLSVNEIVQSLNKNPEQAIFTLANKKKNELSLGSNSSVNIFIDGGEDNSILTTTNSK